VHWKHHSIFLCLQSLLIFSFDLGPTISVTPVLEENLLNLEAYLEEISLRIIFFMFFIVFSYNRRKTWVFFFFLNEIFEFIFNQKKFNLMQFDGFNMRCYMKDLISMLNTTSKTYLPLYINYKNTSIVVAAGGLFGQCCWIWSDSAVQPSIIRVF